MDEWIRWGLGVLGGGVIGGFSVWLRMRDAINKLQATYEHLAAEVTELKSREDVESTVRLMEYRLQQGEKAIQAIQTGQAKAAEEQMKLVQTIALISFKVTNLEALQKSTHEGVEAVLAELRGNSRGGHTPSQI